MLRNKSISRYSEIQRGRNNVPDGACEGRGSDRDGEEKRGKEGGAHCIDVGRLNVESNSGCNAR